MMKKINYLDKVFELETTKKKGLIGFVVSLICLVFVFVFSCFLINYPNKMIVYVVGSILIGILTIIFLYSLIFVFTKTKKRIKQIVPLAVKEPNDVCGIVDGIFVHLTLANGLSVIDFSLKIGNKIEHYYWDVNNGDLPFAIGQHIKISYISNIVVDIKEVK